MYLTLLSLGHGRTGEMRLLRQSPAAELGGQRRRKRLGQTFVFWPIPATQIHVHIVSKIWRARLGSALILKANQTHVSGSSFGAHTIRYL